MACDDCIAAGMLRAVACGVVAGPEVSLHAARPAWKQLLAAQERETATTSSAREAAVSAAIAADLRAMYLRLVAGASDHLLTSVCRHDALYPLGLHDLCDAPQVIHICGDVNRLKQLTKQPTVAVVGARRATAQGREVAYRLGRETAAAGVTVVSGMAFGVDAAAHRGALAADGQTIAVLAGAPSRAYPSSNAALHREIIADGLVISEFPPGAKVARWSFPARNRLIAALAQLTVIVEGRRGSGSIHTAEFAAELGRMVAAVPGSVVSPLSEAPNDLLYDGACMVRSADDILELLFGPLIRKQPATKLLPPGLSPELQAVADAIGGGAVNIALLGIELPDLEPSDLMARLGQLELQGVALRDEAGNYRLA